MKGFVKGELGRMCKKLLWHNLKLLPEIFFEKLKNTAAFESLSTSSEYEVVMLFLRHLWHILVPLQVLALEMS